MKIVIQDTWREFEDLELIAYCRKNHELCIKSETDIQVEDQHDCIFADTSVIQEKYGFEPPATYPDCFSTLYHRDIRKIKASDFLALEKPMFVKPASNNKTFDGLVLNPKNKYDVAYLQKKTDSYIFACEVVDFVNEYRLFVLENEIHGIVESSFFVLPHDKVRSKQPPQNFLNEIMKNNKIATCVIDVGMKSDGEFCVVEVNPPFALSSYEYPIDLYFDYCVKAFSSICN